ncbi:MAG: CRISPR system precrRNA processing endoribonuclease RAMP protein Cas6 [Anaerolineae bacterium]|nr:CRISPR system precrRNA processing endoribonuclease RAMP protein Cas6 [Anaerolineae bacterium]
MTKPNSPGRNTWSTYQGQSRPSDPAKPAATPAPATGPMVRLPAHLAVAQYRLTVEALDMLDLPPFKTSALRGGFGHTFKRLVCTRPYLCEAHCHLANDCPYGYIFETTPPQDSEVLRNFSEIPRPFIIQSANDWRQKIPRGERLSFGLVLVGAAINHLSYFIAVFRELGRVGLGRTQGRYRLRAVEAIPFPGGDPMTIYEAETDTLRGLDTTIISSAIEAEAAHLAADRLTLSFLTPTRLKEQGRWINRGPEFQVVVRTLLGRLSSLSYFHCNERLDVDFRGLIDRAKTVEVAACDTYWEDWSRVSGRQKQRIEMGGLVGQVTYSGDLAPYRALLTLGELIHVGKGTVFGNGQYRIGRG